jgi:putative acetyltransferase
VNVIPYHCGDVGALATLFTASVHQLAVPHYNEAQRNAWAPLTPADLASWHRRLSRLHTLVAKNAANVGGFISYEDNGHIDLLYVDPAFARRGIGSMLLASVATAISNADLFTEASLVAEPFFSRRGFSIVEEQTVTYHGTVFRRYAMRRPRSGA